MLKFLPVLWPKKWSNHKTAIKVVSPANKRKARHHHRRYGSGRRLRSRFARRTGLQRQGILHSGFAPPRPLHRRTGRYQRSEELPERQRLRIPFFYDHWGGDYRAREANVYRLAEVSNLIIDQCVGQGVSLRPRVRRPAGQPFVRRRAGFAYLLRPWPDGTAAAARRLRRPQQGDCSRFGKELSRVTKCSTSSSRTARLAVSSPATSSRVRSSVTALTRRSGLRGGYGNVFFLSTNAMASNGSAAFQCYRKGAGFANPCFTQIHPTCIPVHGDQQSN